MKKISEVTKIVGISRRTLQEYDKCGLLKPTSKTEGGYWLYDDTAIIILCIIQIFIEAGYNRKQIKTILETSAFDFKTECANLIEFLQKKQRNINGLLNLMSLFNIILDKFETIPLQNQMDTQISEYSGKSPNFVEYLRIIINKFSEFSDTELLFQIIGVIFDLMLVGRFTGKPVESKEVQNTVLQVYKNALSFFIKIETDLDEQQFGIQKFIENCWSESQQLINKVLDEPEIQTFIKNLFGAEAPQYVAKAIQLFNEEHLDFRKED